MISRFSRSWQVDFLETLKKLFEDMMIFPVIISHCCRCTEFSDSLGGSDSIVPTLPSSSGKQLFHPTSLETEDRRGTIRHKNQEKEQSSSQAFSFITHKLFIQCIIWLINHQKKITFAENYFTYLLSRFFWTFYLQFFFLFSFSFLQCFSAFFFRIFFL